MFLLAIRCYGCRDAHMICAVKRPPREPYKNPSLRNFQFPFPLLSALQQTPPTRTNARVLFLTEINSSLPQYLKDMKALSSFQFLICLACPSMKNFTMKIYTQASSKLLLMRNKLNSYILKLLMHSFPRSKYGRSAISSLELEMLFGLRTGYCSRARGSKFG